MNAFRPIISQTMRQATAKRFISSGPHANYLSDPSVYPLIGIVGFTLLLASAAGIRTLAVYKDVKINPRKRNSMIQTWGTEDTHYLVERLVYWNSWQKNMPEGLGIDHKKWLAQKNVA